MTRGAEIKSLLCPAGLFRTRLGNCGGVGAVPGDGHLLPSLCSRGKMEMLIPSFQRYKSPIPRWLLGRGQGHQHRQRAAGSWASLPSPAAPANSSLCLHWGGGIGASLPGDLGVPKFFVSPNSSTPSRGRERFGVWLRVDVWQEGCRSCRGDQRCITFCFAPAEGDTPLPPIPPEVMASFGKRYLWVWDEARLFCPWGPAPSSAQGGSRG